MIRSIRRFGVAFVAVRATAIFAAAACAASALADRVLDINSGSITTYVPAVPTLVQGVFPQALQRTTLLDGTPSVPMMEAAAGGGGGVTPPHPPPPQLGIPGAFTPQGGGGLSTGATIEVTVTTIDCENAIVPWIDVGGIPPQGSAGPPQPAIAGVRLDLGAWNVGEVDIKLPAPGFSWVIGRTYNGMQLDTREDPDAHLDSNGYQGRNWFQMSQPELLLSGDYVYIVWGAAQYTEFKRTGEGSSTFKATNGANAIVVYAAGASGQPDTYTMTGAHGMRVVFFGFNDYASPHTNPAKGQLWKVIDPAGNTAYAGDATTGSTAISNAYTTGRIAYAFDSADRRYKYTYTTIDSVSRLTKVEAQTKTGGSWWSSPTGVVNVAEVNYSYYQTGDNSEGDNGNLKQVEITLPLSESANSRVSKRYFRYWKGSYDTSSNPGYPYGIKMIVDAEGTRRYGSGFASASTDDLKPYARAFIEYDSARRIRKTWSFGGCGCGGGSGGGSGATADYDLTYATNGSFSNTSGYDTPWLFVTTIERPDGTYLTQYMDEVGQALSHVITDAPPNQTSPTPPNQWATVVERDSNAMVNRIAEPDAVTYTDSTRTFAISTSAGIVRVFDRDTGSTSPTRGLVTTARRSRTGATTGTTYYYERTAAWSTPSMSVGAATLYRILPATVQAFVDSSTDGSSGYVQSSVSYTMYSSPAEAALQPKAVTVTLPTVSSGTNGSGSATTLARYYRTDGTPSFGKSPSGTYDYARYDNGLVTKLIVDCKLDESGDFASGDDPSNWGISTSSAGTRWITSYTFDAQGRPDTTTLFDHATSSTDKRVLKNYYTELADGADVVLRYADYEGGGTPKYFGPVSYVVTGQNGRPLSSATVAISAAGVTTALASHVDETDTDIKDAMTLGTIAALQTFTYDNTGQELQQDRTYFAIPSTLPGTEGTNYDATRFAYDGAGRRIRTKVPDGTISRVTFDSAGRHFADLIGTNDAGLSQGESSGTNNMVTVSERVYDTGGDKAPGLLTKFTAYVQDSGTDKRETLYAYDADRRLILQTNPQAPHALHKYDFAGRELATGLYSSASGLSASSDPTSVTTNRVAFTTQSYDAFGRPWKSERYQLNSDGTITEVSSVQQLLETFTWWDADGREIKIDGEQLTKTARDRFGRAIHEYTLAVDNDSTYADADDVTGDIVLEQRDTSFDPINGNVIMSASIARHPDDYGGSETTGALDTSPDDREYVAADLKGRIQINCSWFDRFGRMTDTAFYGTNGGTTIDRDGLSVPTRSDTVLVNSTSYDTDGTMLESTDPRGLKTRFLYDDAGRTTATIGNYTDGTPSGPNSDDDIYTRFTFSGGHQATMWVDFDGDGTVDTDDQVTTYTYGVAKGTSAGDSKIASGALLQKVAYPDSSGGSDVVAFAYNAQGQQMWTMDQAGNVIETSFDTGGRPIHKRATTIVTGYDNTVKRISTTYDSVGRTSLITSYDNATPGSGSVLNEVGYTYDGWGNLTSFKTDRDSAIGGSGYYEAAYAYEKATAGRNTLRRTSMTLAGKAWTLDYSSSSSLHDADASRVTYIKESSTAIARYWYLGVGDVVGREYGEPAVFWNEWATGSPATYPDRDQFNRITSSRWTKTRTGGTTDFVDLDITYDRNSNPAWVEDQIFTGVDLRYTNDNLNRLSEAAEGTVTWSGSPSTPSLGSPTRKQTWTLSQTGNWANTLIDLNGDNDGADGGDEVNENRTHNTVNEIVDRDINSSSPAEYTLTHDAVGNLTDDGQTWKFKYDAFGRLKELRKRSDDSLLAEYTYYGNGFRASEHYDADADNDVDGSDPTYFFAWDEQWRLAGVYRGSDSDPKERFLHHQAGNSGFGLSSYIDDLVLRDRDANTAWTSASDGTLEERRYYCQNWRHDVIAMVTANGQLASRARYTAYGIPFGIPQGDADGDGTVDGNDTGTVLGVWGSSAAIGDLNLDGTVGGADLTVVFGNWGTTLGRGKLSAIGNRFGYAGYESDFATVALSQVRDRIYHSTLGRWTRRDRVGTEGSTLVAYCSSAPVRAVDPTGLYTLELSTRRIDLKCCPGASESVLFGIRVKLSPGPMAEETSVYIVQSITKTRAEQSCNGIQTLNSSANWLELANSNPMGAIAPHDLLAGEVVFFDQHKAAPASAFLSFGSVSSVAEWKVIPASKFGAAGWLPGNLQVPPIPETKGLTIWGPPPQWFVAEPTLATREVNFVWNCCQFCAPAPQYGLWPSMFDAVGVKPGIGGPQSSITCLGGTCAPPGCSITAPPTLLTHP